MTKWRSAPRQVAPVLGRLRDDLAPQTLLADVQRVWLSAVGPDIAAQAQPTSERAGVVVVSCAASVWAQELDLLAPAVLASLNEALGAERVSGLRCVAVPPGQAKSR